MIRVRHFVQTLLEAALVLTLSIIWCELGYYYFNLYLNCPSWPGDLTKENFTRVLVLADTHIMGPIKSARIDKLRREWQMKQAYSISVGYYKPDVIAFLGDLFDEGSFSNDEAFEDAYQDFNRIFPYDPKSAGHDRIVIAGNHDIGFHNQMKNIPYFLDRFYQKFYSARTIELAHLPSLDGLNFIASNSMSFYNDTCSICSESIASTNILSGQLKELNEAQPASSTRPVLLIHIPLYRLNDTKCKYSSSLREKVSKDNVEGEDVLHKTSSQFLINALKPRLILSGHTHMFCQTNHQDSNYSSDTIEVTVSSFSHKYAENRPGFLLLSINKQGFHFYHCELIEEWVIASIYIATVIIIISRLVIKLRKSCRHVIYVGD